MAKSSIDAMRIARSSGAKAIEAVVLASNKDGMQFAVARGFIETNPYQMPGHEDSYIAMRLR
jgi:hypothetical protein